MEGGCERTYSNHGEQNVAGSRSLKGHEGRIYERIDGRRGEDEARSEEADDLRELASASIVGVEGGFTATWYVLSASDATVTVTPTMQKNMKTSVHHAKLGKSPRMADTMEATKAMIQASCASCHVSQGVSCRRAVGDSRC